MSSAPPCILHIDADAFFASVEQRDDPRRGRPVAVGTGVVASRKRTSLVSLGRAHWDAPVRRPPLCRSLPGAAGSTTAVTAGRPPNVASAGADAVVEVAALTISIWKYSARGRDVAAVVAAPRGQIEGEVGPQRRWRRYEQTGRRRRHGRREERRARRQPALAVVSRRRAARRRTWCRGRRGAAGAGRRRGDQLERLTCGASARSRRCRCRRRAACSASAAGCCATARRRSAAGAAVPVAAVGQPLHQLRPADVRPRLPERDARPLAGSGGVVALRFGGLARADADAALRRLPIRSGAGDVPPGRGRRGPVQGGGAPALLPAVPAAAAVAPFGRGIVALAAGRASGRAVPRPGRECGRRLAECKDAVRRRFGFMGLLSGSALLNGRLDATATTSGCGRRV